MRYRRAKEAGATYFFTVNLEDRRSGLLVECVDLLRQSFRYTISRHPFIIDAAVIMPDHLHMIWTLPERDADYSTRWALIKSNFSRSLPIIESEIESEKSSRKNKRERSIWQRRFWEHQIRDSSDLENHINYIHYNPVKHGYVATPSNWRHSSIHKDIRANIIPSSWGDSAQTEQSSTYGERQ